MNGRWALLAGALCLAGCVIEAPGPVRHDSRVIDRDSSELVRVNLDMPAGNLRLADGDDKLLRADFAYNIPSWKPEVRYSSAAGRGNLDISQPGPNHTHMGNTHYEWDLELGRDIPFDLRVHFGAGEARLDLRGLSLHDVDVEMGVGKLDMDLRNSPKRSYEVRIRGGVGEATVRLPSDIGISADLQGGIGEIHAPGFHREGKRYFNDAYQDSKTRIHLDIQGGIGEIRLISS